MKKTIDIHGRYSHELKSIANITRQLKKGQIYEFTGQITDEYLHTQVSKLEESIFTLIQKIEYGYDSCGEVLDACFDNFFNDEKN